MWEICRKCFPVWLALGRQLFRNSFKVGCAFAAFMCIPLSLHFSSLTKAQISIPEVERACVTYVMLIDPTFSRCSALAQSDILGYCLTFSALFSMICLLCIMGHDILLSSDPDDE